MDVAELDAEVVAVLDTVSLSDDVAVDVWVLSEQVRNDPDW